MASKTLALSPSSGQYLWHLSWGGRRRSGGGEKEKVGGRDGGREGGREGGKEGERGRERGREGEKKEEMRCKNHSVLNRLTLPFSSRLVSITMVAEPCSHTILQKSGMEAGTGPWVAMNAWGCL